MNKKKVLFIIWSFSYGGGAEKVLANLVNNLNPLKYDVSILEFLHVGIKEESINSNIKLLPPIIDRTKHGIINRIKCIIISRFVVYYFPRLLRNLILRESFDIEISFNYMIPSFLLKKTLNNKNICWVHGPITDLKNTLIFKRLQRKAFRNANKIVSISKLTQKSILSIYPEFSNKLINVYNGYNFDLMQGDDSSISSFDILYCNRLDKNKNPFFLLDVASILKERGLLFTILFLGNGELFEELENRIKMKGLDKQIKCLGFVKNPYPFYKKCRIFSLTSISEGFPTVLIEAMHFGKPFVSTPVGGTDELSFNGTCGFVESSIEKYADRIEMLLSNQIIYNKMSNNCKENVFKYSLHEQIRKVEELFDE